MDKYRNMRAKELDLVILNTRMERDKADRFRKILKTNDISLQAIFNVWVDEFLSTTPINKWGIIVEQGGDE